MSAEQLTLEGEPTDAGRERPETYRRCEACETWILRSRFGPHEGHDRARRLELARHGLAAGDEEEEDEPVEVAGSWFDVRIHKTVEYAFRVPAVAKWEAKELAEERSWDASPADSYTVHTDVDERGTIYANDEQLPDDFDIYGGERLWDAIERAKEEAAEDGEAA